MFAKVLKFYSLQLNKLGKDIIFNKGNFDYLDWKKLSKWGRENNSTEMKYGIFILVCKFPIFINIDARYFKLFEYIDY